MPDLDPDQVAAFGRDVYLVLPGVFDADEVAAMRADADFILEMKAAGAFVDSFRVAG